jgi:lipopolysaccharide transport system ATP-binding protein
MSNSIIEISNISKSYIINHETAQKHSTLGETVVHRMKKIFSFSPGSSLVGNVSTKEQFWALDDVSFNVRGGERVGIIGRNGAGKSTLLKILSRITEPTKGSIKMRGRVASLLEVGTGFHPELTGRENVYLNGAILGMSRVEIRNKFDEIVDFAEVEKFLDTPVKRYSSGMYVRLAFAVAAHLDPDVLIVDEVLAVGDAQFQKKCMGKMEEASVKEGRTILFVSHNLGAIQNLCNRCVFLQSGKLIEDDTPEKVLRTYLNAVAEKTGAVRWDSGYGDDMIKIHGVQLLNGKKEASSSLYIDESFYLEFDVEVLEYHESLRLGFRIMAPDGFVVLTSSSQDDVLNKVYLQKGRRKVVVEMPGNFFNDGEYYLTVAADIPFVKVCFLAENALLINLEFSSGVGGYVNDKRKGVIRRNFPWSNA